MTPLTYTVVAPAATQAYRTADGLADAAKDGSGFGAVLARAVGGAIEAGHAADATSTAAIEGHGSVTDVVTAMSKAELALQTTATIRDRMVQAYQDIMRMPI